MVYFLIRQQIPQDIWLWMTSHPQYVIICGIDRYLKIKILRFLFAKIKRRNISPKCFLNAKRELKSKVKIKKINCFVLFSLGINVTRILTQSLKCLQRKRFLYMLSHKRVISDYLRSTYNFLFTSFLF
jgi:hypothetical protein